MIFNIVNHIKKSTISQNLVYTTCLVLPKIIYVIKNLNLNNFIQFAL